MTKSDEPTPAARARMLEQISYERLSEREKAAIKQERLEQKNPNYDQIQLIKRKLAKNNIGSKSRLKYLRRLTKLQLG